MPSARRPYATPIIVEVKPGNNKQASPSNVVPTTPPSPKAVRFGAPAELVTGYSRPLTSAEAWSLYNFELHARSCRACYDPFEVEQRGGRLCANGNALAQDVSMHIVYRAGEIYSTQKENGTYVRVEVAHSYFHLRSLLRTMDRSVRRHRTVPVVDYDSYPTRRASPAPKPEYETRKQVIVEPARSDNRSSRKTKHKSTRYTTVVIEDDVEESQTRLPSRRDEKRGSIYEKDMLRPKRDYVVEVRQPSERRRREDQRTARSGYYE